MEVFRKIWEQINEHSSLAIIVCFGALYAVYYLTCVVQKPLIVTGGEKFRKFLASRCPIAEEHFWPTWWCFEARFQTVLRFLLQGSPVVNYESEFIKMPDGGEVHLDWDYNNDDSKSSYPPDSRPTVLLMPGLTGTLGMMEAVAAETLWKRSVDLHQLRYTTFVGDGDSKAFDRVCRAEPYGPNVAIIKEECMNHVSKRLGTALRNLVQDCSKKGTSKESYMLNMVHDATSLGYRCVVFMNRGVGDAELKTPRTYCAANIEDLEHVIGHIKKRFPSAPLLGVGVSLGGMILFNYMATRGEAAKLEAAMVISMGWNVFAAVDSLDRTLNYYLFNRVLARGLCGLVKKNLKMFESHLDTHHVLNSKSIKEFDERFTSKIFGYSTVEAYYSEASPDFKISRVAKPVLCLNASDDPFCPRPAIPFKNAEESENVAIIVPSHGGHIGFLEGTLPRRHNYMNRWFVQYIDGIFQHAKKEL